MNPADIKRQVPLRNVDFSDRFHAKGNWGQELKANKTSDLSKQEQSEETLIRWLVSRVKLAVTTIPKQIKRLTLYAGIILGVNLIFWTVEPYFLPYYLQPLRSIISMVVFLTATYNDIVPKSIFWIIIFTFGRKLIIQIKKRGLAKTFQCMNQIIPQFKNALNHMGAKAYPVLLLGGGIGLIIANNFASYSRFSGARNKIDKYFIVLVIAFTLSYLLGESQKTGLFKVIKLGSKDIGKWLGKPSGLSDESVYLLLSGFIIGLILDAPLILMQIKYGGYMLGSVAFIVGIVLSFIPNTNTNDVS